MFPLWLLRIVLLTSITPSVFNIIASTCAFLITIVSVSSQVSLCSNKYFSIAALIFSFTVPLVVESSIVTCDCTFIFISSTVSTVTMCPIGASPRPSFEKSGHILFCTSSIKTSDALS